VEAKEEGSAPRPHSLSLHNRMDSSSPIYLSRKKSKQEAPPGATFFLDFLGFLDFLNSGNTTISLFQML
jgi:hypothetical protein